MPTLSQLFLAVWNFCMQPITLTLPLIIIVLVVLDLIIPMFRRIRGGK